MGKKIFVKCCKSKEKGTLYHTLNVDLGYRVGILTMDKDVICELADLRYSELYSMKADEEKRIGEILTIPNASK